MSEQIIGAGKEEGNTYEDDFVRRNLNDLKRQISRLTQLAELEIPEKINGLNSGNLSEKDKDAFNMLGLEFNVEWPLVQKKF